MKSNLRKTKIVGTIGPASENRLQELFEAGLNVTRINYSHGSWDEQSEKTETILKLREKLDIAYDILFNLRNKGIVPIIAHPERYHYIDLNTLVEYINLGCLLQGNITSLLGKYGKSAKENLELLIKKQMICILGTDTHHDCADLEKAYEILDKLVNKKLKEELLSKNFDKIINNEDIEAYKILDTSTFFKKERIK